MKRVVWNVELFFNELHELRRINLSRSFGTGFRLLITDYCFLVTCNLYLVTDFVFCLLSLVVIIMCQNCCETANNGSFSSKKDQKHLQPQKKCIFYEKINVFFVKSVGIKIKDCIFAIDLF